MKCSHPLLACTLCGTTQREAVLLAGPTVYICDRCIILAAALLAEDTVAGASYLCVLPNGRCTYCGEKPAGGVRLVARDEERAICSTCVDASVEILDRVRTQRS